VLNPWGFPQGLCGCKKIEIGGEEKDRFICTQSRCGFFLRNANVLLNAKKNDWCVSTVELRIETKMQQTGIAEQNHTVEISSEEQPHRRWCYKNWLQWGSETVYILWNNTLSKFTLSSIPTDQWEMQFCTLLKVYTRLHVENMNVNIFRAFLHLQ
jgi:hypothetical protein